MLTDAKIRRLKPADKPKYYADGGGLYLKVSPAGTLTWMSRSQSGKDKWRTLGRYPTMTLAVARVAQVAQATQSTETLTTEEAIKAYLNKVKVVRPVQIEWLMKGFPDIAASRKVLVEILQSKATTAPVMANRMLTRWKDFLNFCLQNGWVSENVLEPVQRRFVGGKENSRNRVLDWSEIREVNDPVLGFILLTGLRPSEAIYSLRHSQTANIPTKRVDYKHTLPKSHLINLFMNLFIKRKLALPSSHLTLSNRLRRAGATYRPHDLRRTFATRLSDLGVMPHVIEKLLGHKMQGVMAVYNHAEYWPERAKAQRLWDKKLIELLRSRKEPSPHTPDPASAPATHRR